MAMWSHSHWRDSLYRGQSISSRRLSHYAEVFNTVEGNTTFYATPSPASVEDWRRAVPDDFRFTFKFPQEITHKKQLQNCATDVRTFLQRMEPLMEKTGLWKIQLPSFFSPQALPLLQQFIQQLPKEMKIGVEVRHIAFFAKGEEERCLNRLLMDTAVNRIIMDSRPVFAAPASSPEVIDAQMKKPRVPVHAIATGQHPMIRFIGHPDLAANDEFFQKWIDKLCNWIDQGLQPYLFVHTPDNIAAPELAHRLYQQLNQAWQLKGHDALPGLKALNQASATNQLGLGL
ncbi:MAG: DUF72 domain-containing protein [Reinekea sp.]